MTPADLLVISREPNVAAFLRVIRACEGTAAESGYRTLFGYEYFDDLSRHPNRIIRKDGYSSSAAGAYQIINDTWAWLVNKYGFIDFQPETQDAAAVALLIRRSALDDVRAGRLEAATRKASHEWASLPYSPYGQPMRTMDFVRRVFKLHGGVENVTEQSTSPVGQQSSPADAHPNLHTAPPAQSEHAASDLQDRRPNDAFAGFDLPPDVNRSKPPNLAIKPMAPVLAALLPSLVNLIPELSKLFGSGSAVSERNLKAAEKVAEVVVAATQAPNLQGAVEAMQADPDARNAARLAVTTAWYDLVESGGGGIAGARDWNVRVSTIAAWRMPAVWISGALLALVFMVVGTVLWAPGWSDEIRLQVVTAVLTIIGVVGSFWLGSSAGSARKTDMLADK